MEEEHPEHIDPAVEQFLMAVNRALEALNEFGTSVTETSGFLAGQTARLQRIRPGGLTAEVEIAGQVSRLREHLEQKTQERRQINTRLEAASHDIIVLLEEFVEFPMPHTEEERDVYGNYTTAVTFLRDQVPTAVAAATALINSTGAAAHFDRTLRRPVRDAQAELRALTATLNRLGMLAERQIGMVNRRLNSD